MSWSCHSYKNVDILNQVLTFQFILATGFFMKKLSLCLFFFLMRKGNTSCHCILSSDQGKYE